MKRAIDCVLAAVALIFILPFFVPLSLLVAMDGGPVFFIHKRIGRYGKPFYCYKFRTMFVGAHECFPEYLSLNPDAAAMWSRDVKIDLDPRITEIGKMLRQTSLDELPQLLNIVLGHMSLVGPRPVTETELVRYGDHTQEVLSVRPGLTGLWQVSGRNSLSYDQRIALDLQYVKTHSLWRDIIILFRTVGVVLRGDGR